MAIKKSDPKKAVDEAAEAEAAQKAVDEAAEAVDSEDEAAEAVDSEDVALSKTAGQDVASPTSSSTYDPEEGVKEGETGVFALQTPYSLVNHLSGVRFNQHSETPHEKDYWIVNQMKAKLIIEIIS